MKKIVNGVEYEMTPEEEAEFIASGPVMERKVESVSAGQFKLQFLAAASWRKSARGALRSPRQFRSPMRIPDRSSGLSR